MGTIKDRNCMDLKEADDIKRLQECTEELYKKGFNDLDNHPEPDAIKKRWQEYTEELYKKKVFMTQIFRMV